MALDAGLVGRSYPPSAVYEVGREKIAEFATALGVLRWCPCAAGATHDDGPRERGPCGVAVTGLEPVTQRL